MRVRAGTLDDTSWLHPMTHFSTRSVQPWVVLPEGEQSNFNIDIRAKNEEISRLQQENVNAITGGDSFAFVGFQVFGMDGSAVNANTMPDDLLLVPAFLHKGRYPLYDVTVRFVDVDNPSI